ncbi:MAG: hypothetical protein A3A58_02255 [Candidatus Blackburnbacteria bacterium RIFCSPLOWO2_01_FULL_41_27]|uniref:DUF4446 domain-containing protein n=2 Tax=Candidatus Blackburniibacteriota TaxID=1817898 RepID=A0A1G1VB51_9BACT|nr:MAG: hypothetical protein A3F61_01390 [Candidatus Blackburnbacteria bacterium RIFCSPHIGHO2_12_FULL_41_13b]OGY13794.1 MAG: hypothetical protein A3A58_02255 [Candidatus Blackburnbacteria bacterium RIFCSPLOWO2_01_FULL_41_27]
MLLSGAAFLVLIIWLAVITFWLWQTDQHYKKLVATTGRTDLRSILERLLSGQANLAEHLKKVEGGLGELNKKTQSHISKVASVRFNPYSNTGSNQSFALAMLDGNNSGVILLSLHGREGTRIYVKPVLNGKSRYELSSEEKQTLEEAIKKS